jgi:chromosome segregation ATPase
MGLDGKKTKLVDADIQRVDFVKAGAQQHSKIAIFKTAFNNVKQALLKKDSDLAIGHIDQIEAVMEEDETMQDEAKLLEIIQKTVAEAIAKSKMKEDEDEDELKKKKKKIKMEEDEDEDELKKKKSKMKEDENEDEDELKKKKSKLEEDEDELKKKKLVAKSRDDRTTVEKLQNLEDSNKQLRQDIAKMINDARKKEFVAKAAELKNIPGKSEDLGTALKNIHDLDPKAYDVISSVLKSADTIIANNTFVEYGSGVYGDATSTTPEDAWNQIEKMAAAIVLKDGNVTSEKAITSVLKTAEGQKLYALYNRGGR